MKGALRAVQAREEPGSKIPKLQDIKSAEVAAGQQVDQRIAERLRTQISPTRIPRIAQPGDAAADAPPDRALQPSSRREHRKQHDHSNLQESRSQHPSQSQYPHKQTKNSSSSKQEQRLPQIPQLHEQQCRIDSTAGELLPRTPRLTKQQQQQQLPHCPTTITNQSHAPHQPHHHHQQQGMHRQNMPPAAAAAGAATPSGWNASLKMHEFLLAQQRKRELYWMAKYGKMLQPPAAVQAVGKPNRNPTSLFRHPAGPKQPHSSSTSAARSSNSSSPLKLPALPATCSQGSGSQASSSRGTPRRFEQRSRHPAAGAAAADEAEDGSAAVGDAAGGALPAVAKRHGAVAAAGAGDDGSRDGLAGAPTGSSSGNIVDTELQQQQQQQEDAAFERLKAKITLASVPKLSVTSSLPWTGTQAAAAVHSSNNVQGSRARQLPCRDLESELQVLRAIHAREDAVDKLRACCNKINAAVGAGSTGGMLLPSDPLGRLFYRLVASLRAKTLDVIESHAAWQRKISNPAEPFSYKGRPYLLTMGQGLGFLHEAPWLAGRLLHCAAVADVLLAELTPDGVTLDAMAGFDVRHGALHVGGEAMRIHMARKLLAAAGAQLPPDTPHSLAAAMLQQQQQQQEQKHQQQQQMLQLHEQHVQQADDSKQQQQQEQQPTNAAAAAAAALGILSARGAALSSSSSDGCRVSNSSSSSGGNCQTPGSSGDVISSTSCEAQTELNGLLQHNTCEDAAPALDAQQQQQQLSPSEDLPLLPAQQQQQIVSASSSAEQLQEVDAACQLPSPPQVQHIEDDQLQQAQEALPADDMHVTEQQQQQQQLLQHGGSSMPDGEPGGTCSEQAGDGQWSGELDVPRLLAAESNNAGGSVQSAHEPVTGQSALCDAETHQLVYGTGAVAAGTDGSYAADCSAQQELPALCADPCTPAAAPASAELHSAGTAGTDVDEVVDGLLNALVLAVEADEGSRVVDQLLLQLLDELECSC